MGFFILFPRQIEKKSEPEVGFLEVVIFTMDAVSGKITQVDVKPSPLPVS